jgi:hypothetical protein
MVVQEELNNFKRNEV